MARWKVHIRLPIRHNWTFFACSYRWGKQNVSRLATIRRGRSVWAKISGEGVVPGEYFLVSTKLHRESKKGCHPNHGYNFVSSWWICKILPLLQRAVNVQQNSYEDTHHTLSMLLHYLGKLKNHKFTLCNHVKRLKCDFLSPMQQISVKCHENKRKG